MAHDKAYIIEQTQLRVMDATTNTLTGTVLMPPLGSGGFLLGIPQMFPNGKVLVAAAQTGTDTTATLYVLDPAIDTFSAAHATAATIGLRGVNNSSVKTISFVLSSDGSLVYIAGSNNTIYAYDTATFTLQRTSPVGGATSLAPGIAISPDNATIYLRHANAIKAFTASTLALASAIYIAYYGEELPIAVCPADNSVWSVTTASSNVCIVYSSSLSSGTGFYLDTATTVQVSP